jgi:transcriptional regulator with XRE-family HTH domain
MPEITFSDDPQKVWLSPEVVSAARGLLNWTRNDLAKLSGVSIRDIEQFESFGFLLDVTRNAAIKRVLLRKCYFSISEDNPGVARKVEATDKLGPGFVTFGGIPKRRPKL